MILFDKTGENVQYIGMQKFNKRYSYLHWRREDGLFKGSSFHTMIAGNYKNISGIGPTILVDWGE